MDNEKLKPCPFCGSEARFEKTVYKEVGIIRCINCRATRGRLTLESESIKVWNTRHQGERNGCLKGS